jgi:hypothetical protein
MAVRKSIYDYDVTDKTTISTTEEPKQEIYVESEYQGGASIYFIIVKVKGKIEGKSYYDYENKYVFRTNKALTKLSCTTCEDGKFLDIATENAMEHMTKLRRIKKTRWSMFHIFMNGKEIEE